MNNIAAELLHPQFFYFLEDVVKVRQLFHDLVILQDRVLVHSQGVREIGLVMQACFQ